MKKWTRLFLLAWILCLLSALSFPALAKEAPITVQGNAGTLMLEPKTMQLSFQPKGSEHWYQALVLDGKSGSKVMKNMQKSMMTVEFFSSSATGAQSGTVSVMDTYSMAVETGGATYEQLEDGFLIHYTIGQNKMVVDDLPKMIPLSKYNDRLHPTWNYKDDKLFKKNYRIVPREGEESVFVRVKDDIGKLTIKQLYQILFEKGGYTEDDLIEDNAAYGYEILFVNPRINMDISFRMDRGDLVVSLDMAKVSTTRKNEVVSFDILPYFLAADNQQKGYLLVPDGSGGLIHLNNDRQGIAAYSTKVYGRDILMRAADYEPSQAQTNLPFFGIHTQEGAILGIIEEGAEHCSITADIAGHSDEYNRIYPTFVLRDIERVAMGGNKTVTIPRFAQDVYDGKVTLRYRFLPGADQGYVQMAKSYRSYLMEKQFIAKQDSPQNAPLLIELIGSVQKQKFVVGIPIQSTVQATTISQAGKVYDALKQAGIQNVHLLFSGLFHQGVKHTSLTSLSLDKGIGSDREMRALIEHVQQSGDRIYPSIYLGRVYGGRAFSAIRQAARGHDGTTMPVYEANEPQLQNKRYPSSAYLAPDALGEYVDKAVGNLDRYPFDGLYVQDLGNRLVGTYKRKAHISRIHARPMIEDALERAAQKPLLMDAPNLYALPYTQEITNLPTAGNGHKLIDESIPFLQMVYEGCFDLSTSSWNLNPQVPYERQLLFAMEGKISPRFTLTYASPIIFHDTQDMLFMGYFDTAYQQILPKVQTIYSAYDAFYQQVKDANIIGHEIHGGGIREVIYDNGVRLLLNFTEEQASFEGKQIEANGYLILGGN